MSEACKDVHVELCIFALSTPVIMVVTVGLAIQVFICENKMNHFALKVGKCCMFFSLIFDLKLCVLWGWQSYFNVG